MNTAMSGRIGIISDTHGLYRNEVDSVFRGVDLVVHAGDIGKRTILTRLQSIAPVMAVRGNVDHDYWTDELEYELFFEKWDVSFFVIHDREQLDMDPGAAGIDVVIFGHSHKPFIKKKNGVFYINPGSAGPRRFSLPITVATLKIDREKLHPELHYL